MPTCLAAGDVGDVSGNSNPNPNYLWQRSIVSYLPSWNLSCVNQEELKLRPCRPLHQYQLLTEEVRTPLHYLQSTRDLVVVVYDVARSK
jgi:hypothetical protein